MKNCGLLGSDTCRQLLVQVLRALRQKSLQPKDRVELVKLAAGLRDELRAISLINKARQERARKQDTQQNHAPKGVAKDGRNSGDGG